MAPWQVRQGSHQEILTPALRAETDTNKRAVLQNAADSTERKLDALVYELYALTPEEIALVEEGK